MLQTVAPGLRKKVRDAASADDEEAADDDAPARLSMLLGALLVVAFRVFAWARCRAWSTSCAICAASRWVCTAAALVSSACRPPRHKTAARRASASALGVHAPTVRLLEGAVPRSSVRAKGRAYAAGWAEGWAEARGAHVRSSAAGASMDELVGPVG